MNEEYFRAIHQVITTGHWITDQVSKVLKDFGASEPQYNVLRILRGAQGRPVAVQEILEHMVQRSSNITRIVDKLVARGYAERKECPTNRRKMDITITPSGLDILKQMDERVVAFHQPYMDKLKPEELQTLNQLITKLKKTHHD